MFLALSLIETTIASTYKTIHCNGFIKKGDEKFYYKLSGKTVKELKSFYLVDGYSPIYNKNVIHKVKKSSCASMLSELEPKITKIKKIVEIPPKIEKELVIEPEPVLETNILVKSFKEEINQKEENRKEVAIKNSNKDIQTEIVLTKRLSLREYFEIILK